MAFVFLFLGMLFPKLQLLVVKTFWTIFCSIVLLYFYLIAQVCLRFLRSYFNLEILIFLSFMMSFLVLYIRGVARFLQTKHLKGSSSYSSWIVNSDIFSVSFLMSSFLFFLRVSYNRNATVTELSIAHVLLLVSNI